MSKRNIFKIYIRPTVRKQKEQRQNGQNISLQLNIQLHYYRTSYKYFHNGEHGEDLEGTHFTSFTQ